MSLFNFSLPAFLSLPSTEKYERKRRQLERLYVRHNKIHESEYFRRYEELNNYVSSPEYGEEIEQIRSMNYHGSKEQAMERRLKELKKYREIKRYRKIGETGSQYVQEYLTLQEQVHAPSFKKRKAFLKDSKRHLKSDAYQKFLDYKRIAKHNDIKNYFHLQKKYGTVFAELKKMKMLFEDEFRGPQIASHWSVNSMQGEGCLTRAYSQSEELQGVTPGNNLEQQNGVFRIHTRREEYKGMAWDNTLGFVPRNYHYTSGLVNTVTNFQFTTGVIEIKLRFPNVKNVYHSLWLGGAERLPFLSGFTYCNKMLSMGVYTNDRTSYSKQKKIALSPGSFYLMSLIVTSDSITWAINGKVVFQCANTLQVPLSIGLSSGIVEKTQDAKLPAIFEIDWIRVCDNPTLYHYFHRL